MLRFLWVSEVHGIQEQESLAFACILPTATISTGWHGCRAGSRSSVHSRQSWLLIPILTASKAVHLFGYKWRCWRMGEFCWAESWELAEQWAVGPLSAWSHWQSRTASGETAHKYPFATLRIILSLKTKISTFSERCHLSDPVPDLIGRKYLLLRMEITSARFSSHFRYVCVGLDSFDRRVSSAEGASVPLSSGTSAALFSVPRHVSPSKSSGKLK